MIKTSISILTIAAMALFCSYLIGACNKMKAEYPHRVGLLVPEGFPQPVYDFSDNPLTKEGISLGRKLFYDDRLAAQVGYSCASCHQQVAAFGTYEHDLSHGVFQSHTLRNAPPLFNLSWSSSFHWDGAYTSLIDEAVHPITGYVEMRESFGNIIRKLKNDIAYRRLFRLAFQTDDILPQHILQALAQFTGTMVSANSKYDRYKKGEAEFTTQETRGYELFKTHCAACHREPLFTDHSFRNIGLPVGNPKDLGRYMVTGLPADSMKYKVPSLRNLYFSSNYFHDGRFITIRQVLSHYTNNVQTYGNVDSLVKNGISLTDAEATDITLFLKALTDSSFINNPDYTKPQ